MQMRHPEQCLAVLRIATGLWFIKAMWSKWVLAGGIMPVPMATQRWIETLPRILAGYAEVNPLAWCQYFLQYIVTRNAELFAHLTAVGEGLVGIGLTFGLMTRLSAAGALFLLLAYQIAALGLPFQEHGLRLFLIVATISFLYARAGSVWALDAWLARRAGSVPV